MQNLELNAAKLEAAAIKKESTILNFISSSGLSRLCYAYKSRVKPDSKLIEKVHRKIKDKANYRVENITDLIGLRLITLFRNEIPKILDEILQLIQNNKSFEINPFRADYLEEVKIFTNGSMHDPFLGDLKSILNQNAVNFEILESKEGYSSVHIVVRMNDYVKIRNLDSKEFDFFIPVEIQIRSVFEDAWGEIDHRFGYLTRAGKADAHLIHNAPLVQPHLKVLKQFSDACAQYADIIYSSAMAPVTVKDTVGKIHSVPSDDEVLIRFSSLEIPELFSEKYIHGRSLRESALTSISVNRINGQSSCLEAAAYFHSLVEQALTELNGKKGESLYLFYAKMNEALCLLSTDSPQYVKSAESMYIELGEKYPTFLLVKFRLAQAVGRLGNIDESIKLFIETEELLTEAKEKHAGKENWPDDIPKADYMHMEKLLPKLIGYQYWKKSEKAEEEPRKLDWLAKAHDLTEKSYYLDEKNIDLSNNLIYYSVEYLSNTFGEPTKIKKRLATSLHKHLAILEKSLKENHFLIDVSTLDTMMQAYNFLNSRGLAQKIANMIIDRVQASDEGNPEQTLSILKDALHIISSRDVPLPPSSANTA
jgi:ppGpp synthetase/RelA/SpoT-type nucleotidyltranferase